MNTTLLLSYQKKMCVCERQREKEGGREAKGKRERGRDSDTHTFLMGARLVMKHIVHKRHTVEYGIIPKRFFELVMRA